MGRAPCCDAGGVKKGPWTPEEDILLVSYIHHHGPSNWRSIPTNTGLRRCSKSCRLRWTNYLRPGIKRGNFTPQEDQMIIHLQALLGNRAKKVNLAIASYLPERTDNDIKNYWNTHLKKKLLNNSPHRVNNGVSDHHQRNSSPASRTASPSSSASSSSGSPSRGQWERRLQTDIHTARQALSEAISPSLSSAPDLNSSHAPPTAAAAYASSAENIAKLLKGWMKKSKTDDSAAGGESSQVSGYSTVGLAGQSMDLGSGEMNSDSRHTSPYGGYSRKAEEARLSLLEKWLLDEGTASTAGKYEFLSTLMDGDNFM